MLGSQEAVKVGWSAARWGSIRPAEDGGGSVVLPLLKWMEREKNINLVLPLFPWVPVRSKGFEGKVRG